MREQQSWGGGIVCGWAGREAEKEREGGGTVRLEIEKERTYGYFGEDGHG